jgi:hypothetical protein
VPREKPAPVTLFLRQAVHGMACGLSRISSTGRCVTTYSAVETEGRSQYKLPGPGGPKRGRRPRMCSLCFCISRWYRYLSIVQINPFRPSPSRSATDSQSFRFSVKMFSRPTLAKGSRNHSQRPCTPQPRNLITVIQHYQDQATVLPAC